MRIGEIAVVGPHAPSRREFIRNACDEIVVQTDDLIFGRLTINNQLVVHLYGVNYTADKASPSWDLVSQKLLGYVVLFDFDRTDCYPQVQKLVDALAEVRDLPLVVAANLSQGSKNVSLEFLNIDINLAAHCDFTFCQAGNVNSVRETLVTLLDAVIEKVL